MDTGDNVRKEKGKDPYHVPVMLAEVIEGLKIQSNGTYVDCTFGGGGHSKAILKELGDDGKLFVFDQDEDARINIPDDPRVLFIPQNFRHISRFLRLYKATPVDGILADLGVSSHQFDEGDRGFSIRFDAALDMRMDKRNQLTAEKVLMESTEEELHKMFEKYGEVTNSKTLAKGIVSIRGSVALKTIRQFKDVLAPYVKGNPNRYFAQVFQALRIKVNDEFGALEEMLSQVTEILCPGGRIVVITFHSLEDRIVKNFLKYGSIDEPEADEVFGGRPASPFEILTKKPILPSMEEINTNPRARSAKLRIAMKTENAL